MRIIRHDDLIDLARGATFLGAGGGGTLRSTLTMIEEWFPRDAEVRLLSVDEAASETENRRGLTCVASFIGSPAANEKLTDLTPALRAVEALSGLTEQRFGQRVARTIPFEIGVQSSAVPSFLIAARLGLDVVDGDGAGRAVPALEASAYAGSGLSASPTVLTNGERCTVIVEEIDAAVVGPVAFAVVGSKPFGAVAGLALWPMDAAALVRALPAEGSTRDTLSLALDLGAQLRAGSLDGALDQVRAAGVGCQVIFRGHLESRESTTSPDHQVVTFANAEGQRVVVYSASENLVLWDRQSGRPLVLAPDSLCYVTPAGEPLSNTDLPAPGGEVLLVAIAARQTLLDSPLVMKTFVRFLTHVGYPGEYVPFARLLENAGPRHTDLKR